MQKEQKEHFRSCSVLCFAAVKVTHYFSKTIQICSYFKGAASKRFGIDGDREAVPLSLEITYNQVR